MPDTTKTKTVKWDNTEITLKYNTTWHSWDAKLGKGVDLSVIYQITSGRFVAYIDAPSKYRTFSMVKGPGRRTLQGAINAARKAAQTLCTRAHKELTFWDKEILNNG